jgi:protease II
MADGCSPTQYEARIAKLEADLKIVLEAHDTAAGHEGFPDGYGYFNEEEKEVRAHLERIRKQVYGE